MATDGTWPLPGDEDVLVECHGCQYRARLCSAGVADAGHFTLEAAKEAEDCIGGRFSLGLLVRAILS